MSDLLDAVFADEAARLVYADALCDRGDPHGELIQIQCALEHSADAALAARERQLLDDHRDRWLGPWAEARRWRYHRGFLHALAIDAPSFADGLLGGPHPELRGLRILELVPSRDPEDNLIVASQLAYILQAPELAGLERLRISSYPLYADNIAALTAAPRLRALRLDGNQLQLPLLRQLVAAPLAALDTLALTTQRLHDGAAFELATSPLVGQLVELDLSSIDVEDPYCNQITDDGALLLARSPQLANLRRLSLSENPINDQTVIELAGSPHPRSLAELDLSFTWVTAEAVAVLHESPLARQLTRLDLGWTSLDSVDLLLDFPNLRWLGVSGTFLSREAVLALAAAPPNLTDLVLFSGRDHPPGLFSPHVVAALRGRFGDRWHQHAPPTVW